ncbi:tyrosine-protein phosphatase [uncultured Endozoicomonas sp.]|uniref:phosphatase domain-containing putative toxin n=1 Tax=uncultured Endozoicomonas sp. TaxID=432652 RepID=UPI0026205176|nr:tyrosine-protein phosphatase [uncultured Endozoicomonas sp.]
MSSHPFDRLALPNGATLLFTPCPGTTSEPLESSLQTLKSAGADAIVTTLPDAEIADLTVDMLGDSTTALGMQWFQLPIEDDRSPEAAFDSAFAKAKIDLLDLLDKKATIVIHCKGGSGRTGLMAAILLLESGMPWAEVKTMVQGLRPNALTLPPHIEYLQKHYVI